MADQTSLSQTRSNGAAENMVGGIAGFTNDVATLAELQLKLFTLDLNESVQKAKVPAVLTVLGIVILLGAVPVLLAGVALLLASALAISFGLSLFLVAIATMIVAGGLAAFAGSRLPHAFETLRRSAEELSRNISWIRTVLVHSGRPAPKRRM